MMRTALSLAATLAACTCVQAGQTEWQEVLPDVRMRLVAMPDYGGTHPVTAAIEIDMPATHKTYWNIPGQSGFAPELDLDGSAGISGLQQIWPLPAVETVGADTDYVYRGHAFLPFSVETEGDDPLLRLSAFVGICTDICMPVSTRFELPLDDTPPQSMGSFAAALSSVPAEWPFDTFPVVSHRMTADSVSVDFAAESGLEQGSVVVYAPDGTAVFGKPLQTASGLASPLMDGTMPEASGIRIAFKSELGVFDIPLVP